MNIEHFLLIYQLNKVGIEHLVDSSDLLNYHYTSIMFLFFFFVVSLKQYVLKPIQCWVPPEFSKSWEEYAENYCWVQPTYVVPYEGKFPMKDDKNQKFNYYQWVPFMILIQMCLSLLPYFLWTKIAKTAGLNFDSIMKIIKKEKLKMESSDKFEEMIFEISDKLTKLFKNRCYSSRKINSRQNKIGRCIILNKLFIGYICIKIVFIMFGFSQIIIMKYFIGNVGFAFGWDILNLLINGHDWKKTHLFPRITGCDVTIRRSGQPVPYSFLCVLPINMLNEKIYIFLWFWMILCIVASFLSLLLWLYKTMSMKQKKRLILKLLISKKGEILCSKSAHKIDKFIKLFLGLDGIFIIEMIAVKHGDVITASLLEKIFDAFENI